MRVSSLNPLREKNIVNCEEIEPDRFLRAIRKKVICKAIVLTDAEKEENGVTENDVKIIEWLGDTIFITRKQFVSEYVLTDGTAVKSILIRRGNSYIVYRRCEKPYCALKISSQVTGRIRRHNIPENNYLVAEADENGNAIMDTISAISEKAFRQQFVIPKQDILDRYIKAREENRISSIYGDNNFIDNEEDSEFVGSFGKRVANALNNRNNVPQQKPITPMNTGSQPVRKRDAAPANDRDNVKKWTVTHRLVDVCDNMVGFIIQNNVTEENKNINMSTAKILASKNMLTNVTIVKNPDTGKQYFRGINISIKNLPSRIIS